VLDIPGIPASAGGVRLRIAAAVLLATVAPVALSDPAADLAARAAAVTADPGHGRILFLKHCAACHRPHAWGDGPREIPALAGQHESYLREQLARYATGQRAGSLKHGSAMHDTLTAPDLNRPQALADLSSYLARALRDPDPEHSEGRALAVGKRTYARACSGCHGADGAGSEVVPAIGGQHYSYVLVQLDAIAAGRRGHPPYAGVRAALPAGEQPALADYIARLTYLTSRSATPAP
jgi:cytochrome c553